MSRKIALLRPEPGNRITAAAIEAAGCAVLRLPLFAARPVDWTPPDPGRFDALLLTSANALRHGGPGLAALRVLPVHAVGQVTAEAARRAGFTVTQIGESGAAGLLATAEAAGVARALLLGGRERVLDAGGIVAEAVTVYASEPLPVTPGQAAQLADSVALVHSARAGARLAALIEPEARATIALAAISSAAAEAAGSGWQRIEIAGPDPAALIDLARALAE